MDFPEYREAVIHLAWFRDDKVRHLLFGMVELRPNELPDTVGCPPKDFHQKNKSRKCLHYRRFVLPVKDVIEWYKNAAGGKLVLPQDPKHTTPGDGKKLEGSKFVQEPPWPHFVSSNELAFAPEWMQGSRTHFLFPENVLSPEVRETIGIDKNRTMLEEWLNFDIVEAYPEYLGAICLVAPNPLFRSIKKSHFEQAREGADETVAYKLVARQGQHLNGLRLEIVNERPRGRMIPLIHEFDNDAIVVLDFPAKIYKEGRSITHPDYGLLYWHEPLSVLRSIRIEMELQRRQKRVQVPDRSHKQVEYEYIVDEVEAERKITVGDAPKDSDIVSRLIQAKMRRSRRQAAKDYDQRSFYQESREAEQYVRQKISNARDTVLIVDPYFTSRELLAFGGAMSRREVKLRILTSTEEIDKTDGNQLLTLMNNIFKDHLTAPEIRIMTRTPPSVHDRFLVVDGTVWLLGNSLHTIGERAGMINKPPDPEPVIKFLESFWDQVPTLSDWLTNGSAPVVSSGISTQPSAKGIRD